MTWQKPEVVNEELDSTLRTIICLGLGNDSNSHNFREARLGCEAILGLFPS
jgi:hypothetical protein